MYLKKSQKIALKRRHAEDLKQFTTARNSTILPEKTPAAAVFFPITFKAQEYIKYYFETEGEGRWKCKICNKSYNQPKNSGYTNLKNHLRTHNEDFEGNTVRCWRRVEGGLWIALGS